MDRDRSQTASFSHAAFYAQVICFMFKNGPRVSNINQAAPTLSLVPDEIFHRNSQSLDDRVGCPSPLLSEEIAPGMSLIPETIACISRTQFETGMGWMGRRMEVEIAIIRASNPPTYNLPSFTSPSLHRSVNLNGRLGRSDAPAGGEGGRSRYF